MRRILVFITAAGLQAAPVAVEDLVRDADYQAARRAAGDGFSELAIPKFEAVLTGNLAPEARARILFELGEALFRKGEAEKSLQVFRDPLLKDQPGRPLWEAWALGASGAVDEAVENLRKLAASDPAFFLTASAMETARGRFREAIDLLQPLATGDNPGLATEARLRQAVIRSQIGEAPNLEGITPETERQRLLLTFLQGRAATGSGEKTKAIELFSSILEKTSLPAPFRQETVLAKAAALALDGGEPDAAGFLLAELETSDDAFSEPAFARLRAWLVPGPDTISKLEGWLNDPSRPLRAALALELLANLEALENPARARHLLTRLRFSDPLPPPELLARSLLTIGRLHLAEGHPDLAAYSFSQLQTNPDPDHLFPSALRVAGLRLAARATALSENPDSGQTAAHLREAAKTAENSDLPTLAEASRFDLTLAVLADGKTETTLPASPALRTELALEKALTLSSRQDPAARDLLENFLIRNPDYPRRREAALALAENCLFLLPPDRVLARSHLDSLEGFTDPDLQARYLLARLSLDQGEPAARQFFLRNPDHQKVPALQFKLAGLLENQKKPGEAHLLLEQLLLKNPDHPLADPARLLSARDALALGTDSAFQQALNRLDELASSPLLAGTARLEKIRALIDRDLSRQARSEADAALASPNLPPSEAWQLRALAAEASRRSGDLEIALETYRKLLANPEIPPSLHNRLAFLTGRLLEELGKRQEALETYYRVINRENQNIAPLEWYWYYQCAFEGALPLLETAGRHPAALALARKISAAAGPRTAQAEETARRLSLEHMIWE